MCTTKLGTVKRNNPKQPNAQTYHNKEQTIIILRFNDDHKSNHMRSEVRCCWNCKCGAA